MRSSLQLVQYRGTTITMMPFVELSIHRFRGGVVTFRSLQDWALVDSSLEYCQRRRETIRRIEFQFPFDVRISGALAPVFILPVDNRSSFSQFGMIIRSVEIRDRTIVEAIYAEKK